MVTTLRTAAILFILVATVMSQNAVLGETPLNCHFNKSMNIPVNWTEISGIWYLRSFMSTDSTYELDASIVGITYNSSRGNIHYQFNYSEPNTNQTCLGPSPITFNASSNTSVVERWMAEIVHTAVFRLLEERTLAIWEEMRFSMHTFQWFHVLTESRNGSLPEEMNNSIFQNDDHCTQFDYDQIQEVNANHYDNFRCD